MPAGEAFSPVRWWFSRLLTAVSGTESGNRHSTHAPDTAREPESPRAQEPESLRARAPDSAAFQPDPPRPAQPDPALAPPNRTLTRAAPRDSVGPWGPRLDAGVLLQQGEDQGVVPFALVPKVFPLVAFARHTHPPGQRGRRRIPRINPRHDAVNSVLFESQLQRRRDRFCPEASTRILRIDGPPYFGDAVVAVGVPGRNPSGGSSPLPGRRVLNLPAPEPGGPEPP